MSRKRESRFNLRFIALGSETASFRLAPRPKCVDKRLILLLNLRRES